MLHLSHDEAHTIVGTMTEDQLFRVMRRMRHHQAAFHDVRDAVAQSVADELDAIAYNRQPDDPGIDKFPEPHVGRYPGWLTAAIWVTAIAVSWTVVYAVLIEWLLR